MHMCDMMNVIVVFQLDLCVMRLKCLKITRETQLRTERQMDGWIDGWMEEEMNMDGCFCQCQLGISSCTSFSSHITSQRQRTKTKFSSFPYNN